MRRWKVLAKDGAVESFGSNAGFLPPLFRGGEIRDVRANDGGFVERLNYEDVETSGDEPALARGILGFAAGPAELTGALQDDEEFEARFIGGAIAEARVLGAFRGEVRTCCKQKTIAALRRKRETRNFFDGAAIEICDGERFFEMKFARLAGGINAVVVVDAIGEVGILLRFEDDHVCADGVLDSWRNEECVAGRDKMTLKKIFEFASFQSREKSFLGCALFQAEKQRRIGFPRNDVPHFCFAATPGGLFMRCGVGVIGMNLDGEFVRRENEFGEQREFACLRKLRAAPFDGHFAPGILQGDTGKRSCRDAAVDV